MVNLTSLQDTELLKGLPPRTLRELSQLVEERTTASGEALFWSRERADTLYLIREGTFALAISIRVRDEDIDIAVEEKTAGQALGWSTFVEPHSYTYSALCRAPGRVILLRREPVEELLARHSDAAAVFSRNLAQIVGARLRAQQALWIEEIEQSSRRIKYWRSFGHALPPRAHTPHTHGI